MDSGTGRIFVTHEAICRRVPGLSPGAAAAGQGLDSLRARIETRIAQTPATAVGVYFRDLGSGDTLLVNAHARFHAASTMKVPVMIQLFRDRDAAGASLDDSILVHNEFRSILDSSPYSLERPTTRIRRCTPSRGSESRSDALIELMETVSSNLATNLLIDRVGAARANATAHALGADSILVLRGVEDGKAYQAGMSNTTTARDLACCSPRSRNIGQHPQRRAPKCSRFSLASSSMRDSRGRAARHARGAQDRMDRRRRLPRRRIV